MQVLPSCETVIGLGFARFTWNNILQRQSYILENFPELCCVQQDQECVGLDCFS